MMYDARRSDLAHEFTFLLFFLIGKQNVEEGGLPIALLEVGGAPFKRMRKIDARSDFTGLSKKKKKHKSAIFSQGCGDWQYFESSSQQFPLTEVLFKHSGSLAVDNPHAPIILIHFDGRIFQKNWSSKKKLSYIHLK